LWEVPVAVALEAQRVHPDPQAPTEDIPVSDLSYMLGVVAVVVPD
jgi:hypothetical protein